MPTDLPPAVHGADTGFPFVPSPVLRTRGGTPYLRDPGVHVIARPEVHLASLGEFLGGFDQALGFADYLEDPTPLPPGAQVCKVAGQLCYASFGPRRTHNRDARRYFENILSSGHGSVLEHACFTLLCYGISRSVTHELVRHRAGFGYSQLSQRYVSGKALRFVERPEYAGDPELHALFEGRVDRASAEYDELASALVARQRAGDGILGGEARTDLRKKVRQTARSVLPNETEAPIVVTGNARAWRHFVEMRASAHAETEIRALAVRVHGCLAAADRYLFGDYELDPLPDGTHAVKTSHPKV
ncbi:MAG: FAD-dependent thymidylate synthase [Chthonomonadales bacterium]|nr:FAD-dependent thymidylate synthase [Chthonomonadales bacterium]